MLKSILITAAIGIVAGFIAGRIMKGRGFGLLGDLIIGLIGALLGGWLAGFIGLVAYGLGGQIVIAILGACILLWLIRLFKR
jgi:uncharacterized membrane protein YeaQ/YmgE (transglycosylase-associated protein family)